MESTTEETQILSAEFADKKERVRLGLSGILVLTSFGLQPDSDFVTGQSIVVNGGDSLH